MKYTDVKIVQVETLLGYVDELAKLGFIDSKDVRRIKSMFKYKCSKCSYLKKDECKCRNLSLKLKKNCFSLYRFFEKKLYEYYGFRFEVDNLWEKVRIEEVKSLQNRLIDSLLDVYTLLPDFVNDEIFSDIKNLCNKCAGCRNFQGSCVADDGKKKVKGCFADFKTMQKLLTYNKEGKFSL